MYSIPAPAFKIPREVHEALHWFLLLHDRKGLDLQSVSHYNCNASSLTTITAVTRIYLLILSVLCLVQFTCVRYRKCCNIFFLLSIGAFRFVRAKIIESILSTDMKQHFEAISKFRVRRLNEEFSMHNSVEDRWATLRMCIKMGDIAHTAISWPEHFSMSCAITEEFYQQGDEVRREINHTAHFVFYHCISRDMLAQSTQLNGTFRSVVLWSA